MDNTVSLWLGGGASPAGAGVVNTAGRQLSGWTGVRLVRAMESFPSSFEFSMTSRFPRALKQYVVNRGDRCQAFIGDDLVLTGWVDRVYPGFDPQMHSITVIGRSKCSDLVDCSAEWKGGQIVGTSALDIATKLAAKYGIAVHGKVDEGQAIPQMALVHGETPYSIIERTCRYRQLLIYDDVYGNLVLSRITDSDRMASGFVQGINVQEASAEWSMDERFSVYAAASASVDTLSDLGDAGFIVGKVFDTKMRRHRLRYLTSEATYGGLTVVKQRAQWECNRRYGRSNKVHVTCDSWRDSAGRLWAPNTLVPVHLPELSHPDFSLDNVDLVIDEVEFLADGSGERAQLVLMPPEAFDVEPIGPPALADVTPNTGRP
jgi:prophage tail gpP-like protein